MYVRRRENKKHNLKDTEMLIGFNMK